jgi:murein DD-endopeptidase MepM/ murein hydrolase activator NlpD
MPGPVRDRGQAEAFQQLESVMLKQMLRSSGAFRSSDAPGAQIHTDMFIETLADAVAKAGGLGIARMLERQMGGDGATAGLRAGEASMATGLTSAGLMTSAGASSLPRMPGRSTVDDLDDPNSSAPLAEDPSAPSIDDYQPTPAPGALRGRTLTPFHGAPRPSAAGGTSAVIPAAGEVTDHITSEFGRRVHPITGDVRMHTGVDLRAAEGVPIRAAAPGVVREAGPRRGYGNTVEIDHGDGTSTLYAHASALVVKPGQHVQGGETVGLVGHTGQATGPHLHFELRRHGHPVDPMSATGTGSASGPISTALPIPLGRALNRYRERVEATVGGTPSGAEGGKP